ncbi:apolipoprotein N-acyltransferase [Propionibacteriaceae bacterium Y1685]
MSVIDRLVRRPLLARVIGTVSAGVALGLSWEPYGWWPLAFVAVSALTLLVRDARPRRAFGLGYLFAVVALVLSLGWIRVLGWPIAAALICFESLFLALLTMGLSTIQRRSRWWPLWAACLWTLCEFTYSRFPFGGFGWTRLAYGAVDGPLAGWFPVVGTAGVSFLVALSAQGLAWLVLRWTGALPHPRTSGRQRLRSVAPVAAGLVGLQMAGGVLQFTEPVVGASEQGTVRVAIVQGNVPGKGIEAMGRMRAVTDNHLAETRRLAEQVRAGEVPQPDFVLWPENSTDIDPTVDPVTEATVQAAVEAIGVPIFVGAVTNGPGPDERQTTGMWWDPVQGPTATYHKRNLVPFGEWIPFRDQLLPVIPMLELVGRQGVPGTDPGVLQVQLADGRQLAVGDLICFELAYDGTVNDVITHGAQVVVVQSNNATYGGTGQIEQQFAITRARAMETRREISVATTNSVSGHIDRHGRVTERTEEFTAASSVVTMPLRQGSTIAVLLGRWVDLGLSLAGLGALLVAVLNPWTGRARRRGAWSVRPMPEPSDSAPTETE